MDILSFRWSGRLGHFRRAETNRDGLTYPVPPRTAILGLLGAVLGLEKDVSSGVLAEVKLAWEGAPPHRFWSRFKLRKDPPALLPWSVTSSAKPGISKPEHPTLMNFELMWRPEFVVHVAAPENPILVGELARRLRDRSWHFTPCLGLAGLLADLEPCENPAAVRAPPGVHEVVGVCPARLVQLLPAPGRPLAVQLLRMPTRVDADRNFLHEAYYIEGAGQAIPVQTDAAWIVGDRRVVFS